MGLTRGRGAGTGAGTGAGARFGGGRFHTRFGCWVKTAPTAQSSSSGVGGGGRGADNVTCVGVTLLGDNKGVLAPVDGWLVVT